MAKKSPKKTILWLFWASVPKITGLMISLRADFLAWTFGPSLDIFGHLVQAWTFFSLDIWTFAHLQAFMYIFGLFGGSQMTPK
jgi:hypothetical protein